MADQLPRSFQEKTQLSRQMELAAQLLLKEQARPKWDLRQLCTPAQLAFIRDPSPQRAAVCGRQGGKTTVCCLDLVDTCLRNPNATCWYIGLTRDSAKKIIWRDLHDLSDRMQLGAEFHEGELWMRFPNGSVIYLAGCATRADVDKFRGHRNHLTVIDEAQSFPPFLEELVIDVLSPTLLRHRGRLAMVGTPGNVAAGYFYEATQADGGRGFKRFHWTLADNPYVLQDQTIDQVLDAKRKERGLPPGGAGDDARFRREYLGRWETDHNARVYRWMPDNHFEDDEVPGDLRCVIGIDTGHQHKDAIAVLGWSESDPARRLWLVDEWVREGDDEGFEPVIVRARALGERYHVSSPFVIDPAAGGSKYAIDAARRHDVRLKSASKGDKAAYIDLLNDDLRTGRFRVRRDTLERRSWAAHDSLRAYWDRSHVQARVVGLHSDIWDAILYAHRECRHWDARAPMGAGPRTCPLCQRTYCSHWTATIDPGSDGAQRVMNELAERDRQKRDVPWWNRR